MLFHILILHKSTRLLLTPLLNSCGFDCYLRLSRDGSIPLYCDNKSAIDISHNDVCLWTSIYIHVAGNILYTPLVWFLPFSLWNKVFIFFPCNHPFLTFEYHHFHLRNCTCFTYDFLWNICFHWCLDVWSFPLPSTLFFDTFCLTTKILCELIPSLIIFPSSPL